jgi:hypothetical protein
MLHSHLNVKRLKEILSTLPDDMEVVVQRDSEGNGYNTAYHADPNCIWNKDHEDVFSTGYSHEDVCMSETEWQELLKDSPRILVIAP